MLTTSLPIDLHDHVSLRLAQKQTQWSDSLTQGYTDNARSLKIMVMTVTHCNNQCNNRHVVYSIFSCGCRSAWGAFPYVSKQFVEPYVSPDEEIRVLFLAFINMSEVLKLEMALP